jgi:hypothetical protein
MSVPNGSPYCRLCMKDDEIEIQEYVPGSVRQRTLHTFQGAVTRSEPVPPKVRLFCNRCGHGGTYDVSPEWRPEEG